MWLWHFSTQSSLCNPISIINRLSLTSLLHKTCILCICIMWCALVSNWCVILYLNFVTITLQFLVIHFSLWNQFNSKFPCANNPCKQKILFKQIWRSGWQNTCVNNSSQIFTNKINISISRSDIIKLYEIMHLKWSKLSIYFFFQLNIAHVIFNHYVKYLLRVYSGQAFEGKPKWIKVHILL